MNPTRLGIKPKIEKRRVVRSMRPMSVHGSGESLVYHLVTVSEMTG